MGKKYLTFSFDDGTVQDKRLIALLDKYALRATFNLNSGAFGTHHRIMHDNIDCDHTEVEPDEVRELYKNHEIAVHTVHHPNLLCCTPEQVTSEVEDDRIALQTLSGQHIVGMAYPGGPFYNDDIIARILSTTGVRYSRTVAAHDDFIFPQNFMMWHPNACIEDKNIHSLCERFLNASPDEDMLLYIWGHSFEFDKYHSWTRAEEIFRRLSGHSDIEYVTNGDIYRMRSGDGYAL
ncbi:MAG: polysaccharide deacetylase family protein [Eubacteriales bacterium]